MNHPNLLNTKEDRPYPVGFEVLKKRINVDQYSFSEWTHLSEQMKQKWDYCMGIGVSSQYSSCKNILFSPPSVESGDNNNNNNHVQNSNKGSKLQQRKFCIWWCSKYESLKSVQLFPLKLSEDDAKKDYRIKTHVKKKKLSAMKF